MFKIGDVILAGYGLKYVISKVNKATYTVVSLFDIERGSKYPQESKYQMKQLDRCKQVGHIDNFILPQEPAATPYNPGDILYNSWGWEQTNIDFYQVIRSTDKTVTIRPIMAKKAYDAQSMTGKCWPIPNSFKGDEIRRGILVSQGRQFVNAEYGCMSLWIGEGKEYSCYA